MELNLAMGNSMDFNDFEIVVARYNENVDWTYQFENVYIYDKCNNSDLRFLGLP